MSDLRSDFVPLHMQHQAKINPLQTAPSAGKGPFIKASKVSPVQNQEKAANDFTQKAILNTDLRNIFFNEKVVPKKAVKPIEKDAGHTLPIKLIQAFKEHFQQDFSHVLIHASELSTQVAVQYNAAALTVGQHIFLNTNIFNPNSEEGFKLLAHELFHTQNVTNQNTAFEVKLKPISELNDQSAEQKVALDRAVKIAVGEKGKVNSSQTNEDKTRVGWEYLLEYFKTTMGGETIVADKKDYKPGKFLEENIKFVKKGKATKMKLVDEKLVPVVENNVDLLPSWCGIFAFWAYHKAGIHPHKWELGKPNFTSKDQYKKGEYLPRPGDLVIKNGYNHHAMVVKTDPDHITDTKDLANVKVTTINGNTAGSNHTGGQIQEKTDPYGYWDYYVKPFFAGVKITPEAEFKVDERLKQSLGEPKISGVTADKKDKSAAGDLSVNTYKTSLEPVSLNLGTGKKEEKKKEALPDEAPKIDPKEIMAKDLEYKELGNKLDKNAEKELTHDTPENKASMAQGSAKSPPTETMGKAKALKVQKLGELPKPKEFKAEDLKNNILKEVNRLLDEKKEEANRTGDKPKIKDNEIKEVKDANTKDIKSKKTESIGEVEKAHDEKLDDSAIEKREATEVQIEEPGKETKIADTEKAVAKPVADERITLEEDSAKIDNKMAENDVDETQLSESNEDKFTGALSQKQSSQAQASNVKEDYHAIENEKLDKDKKIAKGSIQNKIEGIHDARKDQFGQVDTVKDKTKSADEAKRIEITTNIETIYSDSEKSVNTKLESLDKTVSADFDAIMAKANENFKTNVNDALDEEFTWEWAAKKLDRADYNKRVKKVFDTESTKYTNELSLALDPLTQNIASTLNAIMEEIQAAKKAVKVYVDGLDPALAEIGVEAAKGVLEKFGSLEEAVNQKQEAMTNNLAKKYADGVMALEDEFKKIMDSRKSWLEKALDAIIDAIMEIINLFLDLKKALERAVEYAKRIIKAPLKFFGNLVRGATDGFNNFVKNIGKHLLQGALEWITGQMGDAGIVLPEKFDFKGILSLILQILGISIQNVMAIARKIIGEKYVNMLEKGADIGVKAADKILKIFSIIKNEGIAGLWEFIKEQFNDLKEQLMEEAKKFMITTIVEVAVVKIVSMLVPGAGFISAVKSLIDFLRTLFAKARQIVNIITGIIDTFGEVLAGNVGKVANMVEGVLAKFLGLAITFLAAVLGLGGIGKKINDIIQKKIKEPINKAITKMMEKLKTLLTKLGVFKFLDKVGDSIQKGKKFVEDKKDKVKGLLAKVKNYIKSKFKKEYTEKDGSTHTLEFNDKLELERHSVTRDLGNYLINLEQWVLVDGKFDPPEIKKYQPLLTSNKTQHKNIRDLIGESVKKVDGEFEGADKYFSASTGEKLNGYLTKIAGNLKQLPVLDDKSKKLNVVPKTIITYPTQAAGGDGRIALAPLISIDSDEIGSKAESAKKDSPLTQKLKKAIDDYRGGFNLVKGHLINHELHGTGASMSNLGPIPISGNNQMLSGFEEDAKKTVHENGVIYYRTEYTYGPVKIDIKNVAKNLGKQHTSKKSQDLVTDLAAIGDIPTAVTFAVNKLKFDDKNGSDQPKVDDPKNWLVDKAVKAGSFDFDHEKFFF